MADTNPDDVRMSLGDHLEELRWRLFMGLIGPVIAAIALLFVTAEYVIPVITQPLLNALQAAGQPVQVYINSVGGGFGIYLKTAMIGGLIVGIPWLGYQLWKFVEPALYAHERRFAIYLMPGSALLAVVGVLFMYLVALPFTLYFLIGFTTLFTMPEVTPPQVTLNQPLAAKPLQLPVLDEDPTDAPPGTIYFKWPENQIRVTAAFDDGGETKTVVRKIRLEHTTSLVTQQQDLAEYISFVLWLALAFAVSFQLPLVMLGVGFIGVLDYATMRKGWRFVMMGCVVVGAILTPADLASMVALAVPLYILYEFGLLLVRFFVPAKADAGSDAE